MKRRSKTFTLPKKGGSQKTTVTFHRNKAKTNCVLNPTKIFISEDGGQFELLQFSSKSKMELFKPLPLMVFYIDGLFIIENTTLEISASDKSFKKSLEDLELQINDLWDDFVLTDENKLSSDGIVFQKNLLAFVREKKKDNYV